MQNLKQTQKPQEQATDTQTAMPARSYVPPKIKVYKEENMLKTVTVLGCSLQGGFD
jgi:energy-coupling factor transporter transmembrane protein EcfT